MNTKLDSAVNQAIEAHLSTQVTARLKEVLTTGETAITELEIAKERIAKTDEIVKHLNKTIRKHDSLSAREEAVTAREEAVYKAEVTAKVKELKYQLAEAQKRNDSQNAIMNIVFSNSIIKKSMFSNVSALDHNGYMQSSPINSEETIVNG